MSESRKLSISTHVLDTARGAPAAGIAVTLELVSPGGAASVAGSGVTDADGRVARLFDATPTHPDDLAATITVFRLRFDTGSYLVTTGHPVFYPEVVVTFSVDAADERRHFHVPLLLSPFGYSTYRGS